jgi:arylsulfatase A-like enzyme
MTKVHRGRVETMMAVDDLLGTLVAKLQADAELADTVLFFTSDNGFMLGEHRVAAKQQAYEDAIRVPLYAKGPGVSGPVTAHQMVLNVDLAPTILELAQATAGLVVDGHSLVPVLQDPTFGPWRSHFLIEHDKISSFPVTDYAAVRSAQYLWVEYADGQRELYDLATDPHELTSQHANPAYGSVKFALRQVLSSLRTCAGSSCWQ